MRPHSIRSFYRGASQTFARCYSASQFTRDYNGAVQALNSLQSNFAAVDAVRKLGPGRNSQSIPQTIENVRRLGYEPSDFDRLNPIHVAGTKGKGSTSAFVSSILAQYLPTGKSIHAERVPSNVGLYTSPHLRYVRERIKINNEPISEELFAKYFWEVWDRLEAYPASTTGSNGQTVAQKPVYFHYLTLMALHCYLVERIGSAVIECGIGGEYDTTNILVKPSVTGVTSLGIDHEALLGDTIESIAWHKSGIFKHGVPAFSVEQPAPALRVLTDRAAERGTKLQVVSEHLGLGEVQLGLHGQFQRINASLAIAMSAEHLSRLGYSNLPRPADPTSTLPPPFVRGLESARLGGRCDLRRDHVLDNLQWYIDGGHTNESIEVAGKWFATTTNPKTAKILIFNQQTRDASALARQLHNTLAKAMKSDRPFTHAIFCPNTTYLSAGYKPDLVSINTNKDDVGSLRVQRDLAQTYREIDPTATVEVLGTIEEAVARTRQIAGSRPAEVLATGSLHLVGGLIEVLESEVEKQNHAV